MKQVAVDKSITLIECQLEDDNLCVVIYQRLNGVDAKIRPYFWKQE